MFDTSGHLPITESQLCSLLYHTDSQQDLCPFEVPLTNSVLLHILVGSPSQNIFDGLQPLRVSCVMRLFGESIENGIHVLSNKPPAPFMVIFGGAVPNQSTLKHSNAAFGINREDGDVGMSKHT